MAPGSKAPRHRTTPGQLSILLLGLALLASACRREEDAGTAERIRVLQGARTPSRDTLSARDSIGRSGYPIVDTHSGQLFGGVRNGVWLPSEQMGRHLSGGETYRLYGLFRPLGEAKGSTATPPEPPCSNWGVDVAPVPRDDSTALAVAGLWNALPRVPRAQSLELDPYRKVVAERLHAHGIERAPVRLTQIFRIDLDGDGIEEVLMSATNLDFRSPDAPRNGYSVVLARRVIGGAAITVPVKESYYPDGCDFCGPAVTSIAAMLDLNGDGAQEVIVASSAYEGRAMEIFTMYGNAAQRALGWSCGA